jgi:chromosome segregation ATPase
MREILEFYFNYCNTSYKEAASENENLKVDISILKEGISKRDRTIRDLREARDEANEQHETERADLYTANRKLSNENEELKNQLLELKAQMYDLFIAQKKTA